MYVAPKKQNEKEEEYINLQISKYDAAKGGAGVMIHNIFANANVKHNYMHERIDTVQVEADKE